MKKETKILEKDIQRQICDWLSINNFFFWRNNNVPIFGRSNDGVKRFRAMPKYTPKGLPDIIVLVKGKMIGLEVKRPDNPSKTGRENQQVMGEKITLNGGLYKIVFNLPDVTSMPEIIEGLPKQG